MMQIHQRLVALTPNAVMLEYTPRTGYLLVEPATVEEGCFKIPRRPGAATEIKPEVFEQFRVK